MDDMSIQIEKMANSQNALLLCSISLSLLLIVNVSGCTTQKSDESSQMHQNNYFGTWQNDEVGWSFQFEPGGTISHVDRWDGLVMDLSLGGVTIEAPNDQMFASYVYGPCTWHFDENSNYLRATVTIEDLYVSVKGAGLSCKMIDSFEGPVSENGLVWTAFWTTTTIWHDNAPDQLLEKGIFELRRSR